VIVQTPYHTAKSEIDHLIEAKKSWLHKRLYEHRERKRGDKSFIGGEAFLYLGDSYPLFVIDAGGDDVQTPPLALSERFFLLRRDHASEARRLFVEWYRDRALKHIRERVLHFSSALDSFPRGVRISNATCRWGSCSADNRLFFSWRLVMAPPQVIDYVVLHEFAHMHEKNHSRRFWNIMETVLPDYNHYKRWLRENGHLLTV